MVRSLAAGGPLATSTNAQSSGSTVLYAGLAGQLDGGGTIPGHLFVTTAANTAPSSTPWTDAAHSPVTNDTFDAHLFNPGAFDISSIATDPHDTTGATVYATIMGFGSGPHLYRSTDFGAHWLLISGNLPQAPANAVVVDPNDANTVYVAMDTGVFVTQAVTTCASTNCWSPLGTGLPNAPVTTLEAAPQMPTGDGRSGMLRAGTYGRGLWQIPLLNATTIQAPAITLSSTSLTFTAQAVATQSTAQTITVTSSGNQPVTFGAPAVSGDFVETDNCAGQTLATGATCTFNISFAPTKTGTRSGQLTIYANVPGGQATVSLSGTGTAAAAVVLTPLTLTFPATLVNQTAASQIVTVANTGANPVILSSPIITGDFKIAANTCGATLAPQTACSLSISFTPTAGGARTGVLTVTDSAGTQTAQLTGTGNAPATDTLAPTSLTFAQQAIGTTSVAQQITLTNAGDVALTLIAASVSPGDFTATNSCGASLNPHSTCAISVAFVPTAVGTRTATVTVTDQFRSQTVGAQRHGRCAPRSLAQPGIAELPRNRRRPQRSRADAHADQQRRPPAASRKHRAQRRLHDRLLNLRFDARAHSHLQPRGRLLTHQRRSRLRNAHAHRRRTQRRSDDQPHRNRHRLRPRVQRRNQRHRRQRNDGHLSHCCSAHSRVSPDPSRSPAWARLPTASAPSTRPRRTSAEPTPSRLRCRLARLRRATMRPAHRSTHATLRRISHASRFLSHASRANAASRDCCCRS